jgi:hypothetical protein
MYYMWYTYFMPGLPKYDILFYKIGSGRDPVREWLKEQTTEDKKRLERILRPSNSVGQLASLWPKRSRLIYGKSVLQSVKGSKSPLHGRG